jgi:MFS family permease
MSSFPVGQPLAQEIRLLPRAWIIVALLWLVGCLNYLDRVMLTTMRDSIKEAIPMGDDGFGGLTTVFLWVYAVLSPVGGWCADRFGRSRVIILSVAVWSAVTLLTSFAKTYHELLLTRALMGISEACYIPAALALIADYHRGNTRSLATGIHMSGIYAGMALGGMGGWMADRFGWSAGFFTFGCFGIVYAVVLLLLLKDAPHPLPVGPLDPVESPLQSMKVLGRSGQFWLITLHWGLLGFGGWAFLTWMPTFLRERHHLSQTEAGFTATAYMQVAAFCGVLVGGAWADRWSRTQLRGRVWVPMIALTLASPFVFMVARTDALWFAVVCLIAYGFARGCSDANMMPILCQIAEPRHRATGYGMLNFFSCATGGVAAYLGGWLKEHQVDLSWLLTGSSFITCFCGLILLLVRPTRRG